MRIIHVLHSHGYGGAESHALLMLRGLRDAGHDVLFAGPLDSWLGEACAKHGIAAEHLGMHGLFDVASHLKLRRLVKRWQPDIVHGHLVRGAQYAGLTDGGARAPVALCTAHATTAYKHMGRCRHIIAVSKAVQDNLVRHGYDINRTTVVYNGVPDVPALAPSDRASLRFELGIPDDAFAVVNAGRFIRDKGQDLLLAALPQCPPHVHLYLIGDPETDFGRTVFTAAHDRSRVHFMGYRGDVQRILPAFDAYALSSRREALPLSLAEAMAATLPIVATTVGGVPEIILDQQTGLHARPDDAASLASGITRLATDTALAQRVAHAARQLFVDQLTVQRMLDNTLAVYQRCLDAAARP